MLCSLLGSVVQRFITCLLPLHSHLVLVTCFLMILFDRRTIKTSKMKRDEERGLAGMSWVSVLPRLNTLQCLLWEAAVIEEWRLRVINRLGLVVLEKRRRKWSFYVRRHLNGGYSIFFLLFSCCA
ncbi:hypothetical protein BDV10DRAFT_86182 [Aspergillus recurvatus]